MYVFDPEIFFGKYCMLNLTAIQINEVNLFFPVITFYEEFWLLALMIIKRIKSDSKSICDLFLQKISASLRSIKDHPKRYIFDCYAFANDFHAKQRTNTNVKDSFRLEFFIYNLVISLRKSGTLCACVCVCALIAEVKKRNPV